MKPDKPCTTKHFFFFHFLKEKKKPKTPKTNTSPHCLLPCFCIVMFNGPSRKDTKCHVLIQTTPPTLNPLSLSFYRRQKETASLFSSLSSSLSATHSMVSVLSVFATDDHHHHLITLHTKPVFTLDPSSNFPLNLS